LKPLRADRATDRAVCGRDRQSAMMRPGTRHGVSGHTTRPTPYRLSLDPGPSGGPQFGCHFADGMAVAHSDAPRSDIIRAAPSAGSKSDAPIDVAEAISACCAYSDSIRSPRGAAPPPSRTWTKDCARRARQTRRVGRVGSENRTALDGDVRQWAARRRYLNLSMIFSKTR